MSEGRVDRAGAGCKVRWGGAGEETASQSLVNTKAFISRGTLLEGLGGGLWEARGSVTRSHVHVVTLAECQGESQGCESVVQGARLAGDVRCVSVLLVFKAVGLDGISQGSSVVGREGLLGPCAVMLHCLQFEDT